MYIDILNDEEFKLKIDCKDQNTYDIKNNKKNNIIQANLSYNSIHEFEKQIKTDYFSFKLVKTPYFNKKTYLEDNTYSFKLYSLDKITKKYLKDLNISPVSKESSVLKLSISGNSRKKNIDYLNTLSTLYLKQGLEEKIECQLILLLLSKIKY